MYSYKIKNTTYHTTLSVARFQATEGEVVEHQVMIELDAPSGSFSTQKEAVMRSYEEFILSDEMQGSVAVFKRFFLSDAANQSQELKADLVEMGDCAVSVIEQPPMNRTKIALWVYLQSQVVTHTGSNGVYKVCHGVYTHLWMGNETVDAPTTGDQMRLLLYKYILTLADERCTLFDHCVRSWIFVHHVDSNYPEVVKARKEVFLTQNMTEKTHFIASTGIGGRNAEPNIAVQLDTYAVAGLRKEQKQYLYAPLRLSPTYHYGVTFERGICVKYGDRRHVFISGTASINEQGTIMFPGDVVQQTYYLWENVEALLAEAQCTFNEVAMQLIYVRDMGDYESVKALFDKRFPQIPKLIVHASECRQRWLVEMECIAMKSKRDPRFPKL